MRATPPGTDGSQDPTPSSLPIAWISHDEERLMYGERDEGGPITITSDDMPIDRDPSQRVDELLGLEWRSMSSSSKNTQQEMVMAMKMPMEMGHPHNAPITHLALMEKGLEGEEKIFPTFVSNVSRHACELDEHTSSLEDCTALRVEVKRMVSEGSAAIPQPLDKVTEREVDPTFIKSSEEGFQAQEGAENIFSQSLQNKNDGAKVDDTCVDPHGGTEPHEVAAQCSSDTKGGEVTHTRPDPRKGGSVEHRDEEIFREDVSSFQATQPSKKPVV